MLAEIFMLRLEATIRANQYAEQAEARFVRFDRNVPVEPRVSRDSRANSRGADRRQIKANLAIG